MRVRDLVLAQRAAHPDWSQAQIAQALGVCRATVNRWLRREAIAGTEAPTTSSQQTSTEALEEEIRQLRLLVQQLLAERAAEGGTPSSQREERVALRFAAPRSIPEDWDLSDTLLQWTLRAAAERGRRVTREGLHAEVRNFHQYWQARATRRLSWDQTWQQWWRKTIPTLPQFAAWDQSERESLLRGEWPQYRPVSECLPVQQELPAQLPPDIAAQILENLQGRAAELRRLAASKSEAEWDRWLRAEHARRNAELVQRGRDLLTRR